MSPPGRFAQGIRTIGFMIGITIVCVGAVSVLHVTPLQRVHDNADLFVRRAVRTAAGLPPMESAAALAEWFTSSVTPMDNATAFQVRDPDTTEPKRVILHSGPGLWGRITAAIGLDAEGRITGMTFTEQNETPGLGARIAEPWFGEQVRGKSGPFRLVPEGTRSTAPDELDGITGATITSTAVRDILNAVLSTDAKEQP